MGQTRAERTWPRPARVKHVWVRGLDDRHPLAPPSAGLVLGWARRSGAWRAHVLCLVDDGTPEGRVVAAWVDAGQVRPVASDPNRLWGLR